MDGGEGEEGSEGVVRDCPTGKKRILDAASAEVKVRYMKGVFPKKTFRKYVCPFCGFWHLTSKERK